MKKANKKEMFFFITRNLSVVKYFECKIKQFREHRSLIARKNRGTEIFRSDVEGIESVGGDATPSQYHNE